MPHRAGSKKDRRFVTFGTTKPPGRMVQPYGEAMPEDNLSGISPLETSFD